MIGVITYISVLERKKEIGILRSIGASKGDIGNVFNAETIIIGFVAGMMGIILTLLLSIPANIIVDANFGIANIAILPIGPAALLVGVSVILTFIAGLMPSSAASRKDPVEALRSE
jgi:ABC-type antimicrobial peptide transport system permease subunit